MPALYLCVDCSRAAEGIDDAEVGRIVEVAQRHNVARGITEAFVFGSGISFLWIEGPAAQMKMLIASLHRDPRHYDLVALDQSGSASIRLGGWSGSRPTISGWYSRTRWIAPRTRTTPRRSSGSCCNPIQGPFTRSDENNQARIRRSVGYAIGAAGADIAG
ncbi:BLUF domain-containing protein [Methylobacterium sp. J-088]|uniref:BLUF domain-containing protein n=1 Tax=Methylobacterium sp. J-088 TaxID=2836664 RepID=UPI001FB91D37|nr:BLUF domain-containing protein [Methylobacterium sp. J-088]MCJ2064746.1 BLUF domain-containing protein [Methylobacterium sp. J-088]